MKRIAIILIAILALAGNKANASLVSFLGERGTRDTVVIQNADSLISANVDSLANVKVDPDQLSAKPKKQKVNKDGSLFVPNPNRALWLALICPGAGQIYNRKYWKLPIIYGGFIGCTYAFLWNQQMYNDYRQAYLDIMDDDPTTDSYVNMLPMGYDITGQEEQFQRIFRHKRDYYRKYRDLSIFAFVGVYLISVVDAYVDAQLSTFDISKDLSVSFEPTSIEQKQAIGSGSGRALGVQCNFNF